MFEVGFTELLLIFALALLVLGPQKLPKLAQQVGRWVGRARAMARQFRDQLEEEAHNLETKVSIDPGIDTSLDGKRDAQRDSHASTGATSPPASPEAPAPADASQPADAQYKDVEEEFYPPDHHMHPANRTNGDAPDEGGAEQPAANVQAELDLTDNADKSKTP
jgi:sec-independent protein translocase protein TatB